MPTGSSAPRATTPMSDMGSGTLRSPPPSPRPIARVDLMVARRQMLGGATACPCRSGLARSPVGAPPPPGARRASATQVRTLCAVTAHTRG